MLHELRRLHPELVVQYPSSFCGRGNHTAPKHQSWDVIPGLSDTKAYALKQFPREKRGGSCGNLILCPAGFSLTFLSPISLIFLPSIFSFDFWQKASKSMNLLKFILFLRQRFLLVDIPLWRIKMQDSTTFASVCRGPFGLSGAHWLIGEWTKLQMNTLCSILFLGSKIHTISKTQENIFKITLT